MKKISKGGILIPVGISALVVAVLIALSTIPIAKAQIFPLSEQQLPPGTYVVTREGYWPIQAWVAAHPGKPIPASIIVVREQPQPTTIVKEKTKVVHEHHKDKDHHDDKCRFRDGCPPPPPPPPGGGSDGGGSSGGSGGGSSGGSGGGSSGGSSGD